MGNIVKFAFDNELKRRAETVWSEEIVHAFDLDIPKEWQVGHIYICGYKSELTPRYFQTAEWGSNVFPNWISLQNILDDAMAEDFSGRREPYEWRIEVYGRNS